MLGRRGVAPIARRAHVDRDPFALVEDLDAAIGDACPELLLGQRVGHRVIGLGDHDVVVEAGAALFPFGVFEGHGGQRLEGGPVDPLEQLAARSAQMAGDPAVQILQQFGDGLVQLGQREEAAVAQTGQDPALDDLDGDLHLGLVARLSRPRRHDGGAVVGRHVGIGPVDLGIVKAGPDDAGLEVIRYHLSRHAAEIGKGAGMGADPVGQALGPGRLGVAHARRSQGGDEDLDLADLAGQGIDHLGRGAGVIDEQLLAGNMGLAHGGIELALPGPVEVAEAAVAVALAMDRAVFLPQERKRHAGSLEFQVQDRPVRRRPAVPRVRYRWWEKPPFQILVAQAHRQGPAQTGPARALDGIADRRAAEVQADGNSPPGQLAGMKP